MVPAVASLTAGELEASLPDFAEILHACVGSGASVGFVQPFSFAMAEAFWRAGVAPALRARRRVLLGVRTGGRYVGTVQVLHDTPPNQPHRVEAAKLLVHPAARRRGIARALMTALETETRTLGRSLITLDTRSGDPAETLYAALGYTVAGVIPGWCRDTASDRLDPTTIMFKALPPCPR